MNSRERVLNSIEFKPVDRVPVDLGGMASTSISAFAHPKLREYLGLKKVRSLVYDTGQMLALPEKDLLDMLGVDVVTTNGVYTNAFDCIFMFHLLTLIKIVCRRMGPESISNFTGRDHPSGG